jgi:hypothetical protein
VFFRKAAKQGLKAAAIITFAACLIQPEAAFSAASAPSAASDITSILDADALPPNFSGDDPVHVRDALSGHISATASSTPPPSIEKRVRTFLTHPLQSFRKGEQPPATTTQASRTFVFVLPASYGVRYEAKRKLLSVNVSLASPETPDAILLRQTVKGQSGRKLVIAPEAKAKGFIQTFDTIQFRTKDTTRTNIKARTLAPDLADASNGDFAIVLVCTLEPPYMTDHVEHSDPTDEEPTDITHRTSTLQGVVNAVWLIDRKNGVIISKRLRLVK